MGGDAYYNEIDPGAAATLRELIKAGVIAPGDVDERSIEDVTPNELLGYSQCHFFAGAGIWSYALRLAGIPDDYPLWTGSCPCQPFSPAGKGKGFADERHLWPAFYHLISQCGPHVVFGEQVAGKDGLGWLDLVQADLEAMGYACGAVPAPAAGFGTPHIRERLYWVADTDNARLEGRGQPGRERADQCSPRPYGMAGWVGNPDGPAGQWNAGSLSGAEAPKHGARLGLDGRVADRSEHAGSGVGAGSPGPVNGFWRDADWLGCRDGKWRPVEPGTFPLAHGAAERVGRVRLYGNGLVAPAAAAFIEAYFDVRAAA